MQEIYIYELIDPRDNTTKYIGKTNQSLNTRLTGHFNAKKESNRRKFNWIQKLKRNNLKPIINLLDIVTEDNWQFWECWWIELYKSWGLDLHNVLPGGQELRFKKGKTYEELFGEKKGKELREIRRKAKLGKKHSEETKEKMRRPSHRKGKKIGPNLGVAKAIYQIDKKTNKIIKEFYSITLASKELNIDASAIHTILKNKVKNPRFFNFKYKENA